MRRARSGTALRAALLAATLASSVPAVFGAQSGVFQIVLGVTDASGMPVTDLRADEVVVAENGSEARVVGIEPFGMPVKVTLAVDNGLASRPALSHYRSGLSGLVEALPEEVEVTLITTAPQPRVVVGPTTDRAQLLRGINGFAPEEARPMFTDALVEFSKRVERQLGPSRRVDYLPVLVMVSTTANEAMSYQVAEIERAITFLAVRKARVMVAVTSTRDNDTGPAADLNTNRQVMIAVPATEATRGRYEALAISNRLATLLPEMGAEIAQLHKRHMHQFRVTVQRADAATGPIQGLGVGLTRPGLTGSVSMDGLP